MEKNTVAVNSMNWEGQYLWDVLLHKFCDAEIWKRLMALEPDLSCLWRLLGFWRMVGTLHLWRNLGAVELYVQCDGCTLHHGSINSCNCVCAWISAVVFFLSSRAKEKHKFLVPP